jgi:tetratricopeptide (TPR) repeat protein
MDAHGTTRQELIRRANWWYRQGKSSYSRGKLTAKSWYVETRARIAQRRGDDATARRYRSQALYNRRMLRDPGPALENVVALSALERERGNLDEAAEYLDEGRQICAEVDPTPAFREEVRALADAYEERGDDEAAAEWYFTAIYLSRATDPDFEARRAERHRRYLELAAEPDAAANVYDLGLRNVLYGDDDLAAECLAEAWSRESGLDASAWQYPLVLAAGVGLLALDALGSGDLTPNEREAIRQAVADGRDGISRPASALFDAVEGEDVDRSAFEADVDPRSIRVNLGELEEAAYATLLERLDGV